MLKPQLRTRLPNRYEASLLSRTKLMHLFLFIFLVLSEAFTTFKLVNKFLDISKNGDFISFLLRNPVHKPEGL